MVLDKNYIETLISEYEIAKSVLKKDPISNLQQYNKVVEKLNKQYWEKVEQIMSNLVRRDLDEQFFNRDERFVLDMGYLDHKFLELEDDKIKYELTKELYYKGDENISYLSEWLLQRYKSYLVYKDISEIDVQMGEKLAQAEKKIDTDLSLCKKLQEKRKQIYYRLKPYFTDLPGLSPEICKLAVEGRVDEHIEQISLQCIDSKEPKLLKQRLKLREVRRNIIGKVKTKFTKRQEFQLLDLVDEINEGIWKELVKLQKSQATLSEIRKSVETKDTKRGQIIPRKKKESFLKSELKLLKSIVTMGTFTSGIKKTHFILLSETPRISKPKIEKIFNIVKEADTHLPGIPKVLIVPFFGTGFFEWDRDTIFIPLMPSKEEAEAIIDGIVSYRIMIDQLQHHKKLKKSYEMWYGDENYREKFTRDYKNWLLGICQGKRGALDSKSYKFFKENIGPNPDEVIAPRHFMNLSPKEIGEYIKKYKENIEESDLPKFENYYSLAVLNWLLGRVNNAFKNMKFAAKLNPASGKTLLSLGILCSKLRMVDSAKRVLNECINIAPNTLWHIYAADILNKL